MMKQGLMRTVIPDVLELPDANVCVRLLSLLYYVSEFEFAARFSYYTPRRLLTGSDAFEKISLWTSSAADLTAARHQILEALLCYVADNSPVQLQAMSSVAAAALERHKLPLVGSLTDVLA
jgi:hypothetical protein